MNERDRIYVQILHFGLISLRNASYRGDVEYWRIESDHLHNLPSLIGETNEHHHDYYLDAERVCYLESVQRCDDEDARFARARYVELWEQLENLRAQKDFPAT